MKRILLAVAVLLVLTSMGCKRNPKFIIPIPYDPIYVGEYLQIADVYRIAHALDTAPTRSTVQWENEETGYQYSMMVFSADTALGKTTRSFSILSIQPSGDAEVLNLIGTSETKNEWNISAQSPASSVGKAVRMDLPVTPNPVATRSSESEFIGFIVVE